jgi:hypothetical protein
MQRTKPPFRADHVGSLLRPAALKAARARRERNEITAEQLQAVEDREIDAIIRRQEEVGLHSAARSGTTTSSASFPASRPISASARSSFRASSRSR